jgi:hypothetical protein
LSYEREYTVYVLPQSQKLYKDNYGNTMTLGDGGDPDIVILVSEGYDPYNITSSEFIRYKGKDLFNVLIQLGYKIYFLNYAYNCQDMRNSAAIYNSAIKYVSNLNSNSNIIAAGVSMGGVIVRYCLSKAEQDGTPLPVDKFISIDAPQQGAIIANDFQYFINNPNISGFQKKVLNNTASKHLLKYNTFGSLYTSFYNELDNLNNGTGYPGNCENIGVSFSNGSPNPGNGRWLVANIETVLLPGHFIYEEFDLNDDLKVPGSYLPRESGETNPSLWSKWYFFFVGLPVFGSGELDRDPNNNPTFIPYTSSLDIVNGNSKFDGRV